MLTFKSKFLIIIFKSLCHLKPSSISWYVWYIYYNNSNDECFVIFSGRSAYIGLGFGDRSDSFDLNVALQDHFKWLKKEQEGEQSQQQNLDLGFKDGETIKINMKITVSIKWTFIYWPI